MTTKILILDDNLTRVAFFKAVLTKADVTFVHTAADAIRCLSEAQYEVVFLDHDLGGQPPMYYGVNTDVDDPNTGSEVVRYITRFDLPIGKIIIHSMNDDAANHMVDELIKWDQANIIRIQFDSLTAEKIRDIVAS